MTESEVALLLEGLPGVIAVTASSESGAPEVSWGDSFFFYDPDQTADRRQPFATIVTKDYPGFDTSSKLDRPGVFRLNLAVGRETFQQLFGFPSAGFADQAAEFDFAELDRVLPHPVYARQGWISVLTPGPPGRRLTRDLGSAMSR